MYFMVTFASSSCRPASIKHQQQTNRKRKWLSIVNETFGILEIGCTNDFNVRPINISKTEK